MKTHLQNEQIDAWLKLSRAGNAVEAEEYYHEFVFPAVVSSFEKSYSEKRDNELLVSLLGFSPEPVILTARALKPAQHIVFSPTVKEEPIALLDKYLGASYKLLVSPNDDFLSIYKTLKETLSEHPTENITIDITGGKKSLVATAAIFGKDYGSRIVYVDFSNYLKDLRKPYPGTELLRIVYDPASEQPEINI